jgi:hypothetical protein
MVYISHFIFINFNHMYIHGIGLGAYTVSTYSATRAFNPIEKWISITGYSKYSRISSKKIGVFSFGGLNQNLEPFTFNSEMQNLWH